MPGSSSTDFWGIAHVPSLIEDEVLPSAELERRLTLLRAAWAYFDDVVGRVPGELLPSGRTYGRTREQIARHVYINEPEQFSRKVEVRTDRRRRDDAATAWRHTGRPTSTRSAPGTRRASAPGPGRSSS